MKKRNVLLLASLSLVLTSCGTTYVNAKNENAKLSLTSSSFTLSEKEEGTEEATLITKSYTWESTHVQKGSIVESSESKYTLSVNSVTRQYVAEGEGASVGLGLFELEIKLESIWTDEEISKLLEGKKVSKNLDEDDCYKLVVVVDDEAKTWSYTL